MMADRWPDVDRLYLAACEREPGERDAFLNEACGGDRQLLEDVQALLRYESAGEAFLERDALEEAAKGLLEDSARSLVGRQLDGYEVLSLLGAGGMGEVYRARDLKLGREVAIKVLARLVAGDADYLQRFEEEARVASILNHPNIVTIYGVGEVGDVAYMAMELVEGRTLRTLLQEQALPMAQALEMAEQLAEALSCAHAGGIVHRDLKPENVMVTRSGLVKVLDFGLARRHDPLMSLTRIETIVATVETTIDVKTAAGVVLGSVGYMSPEQASGLALGPASDQFSFGVILYEMLSRRRAFARPTAAETLSAIVSEEPHPIQLLNPAVSLSIQQLIARLMAKDAANRYADTRDVVAEVTRIRESLRLAPRAQYLTRRQWLGLAGGAGLAAATGLVAWRLWPRSLPVRSMAVLPFENTARDPEAEYLCDGIAESVIRRISQLSSLRVMARSTVFTLKGKAIDPRTVGRQLGVDAVLLGSVAQAANQLHVTAELVDVATGTQLWSARYDRRAGEALVVQDEIARAIVDQGIRLKLSTEERRQLVRRPTNDPEAYELYLQARYEHMHGTEDSYLSARQLLKQAIAKDPTFALAHVALAATYTVMAVDGLERPTDAWPEVNRNVRLALDLDPDLPEAHVEAASHAFFFNWDWPGAEREWRAALQSPASETDPDLQLGYSLERWALGKAEEALQLTRKVRDNDPLNVAIKVREADLLMQTSQLDAAVTLYEEVVRDEPTHSRAYYGLAEVRRAQGRFDDAIAFQRRAHAADGDDDLEELLASVHGEQGYRKIGEMSALLQLKALTERAATAYASPLDFARLHAQLGQTEESFQYLEAAFADRSPGLVFLNVDRSWNGIRNDPRFVVAVRRVGLS